jgi:hypothetical protein
MLCAEIDSYQSSIYAIATPGCIIKQMVVKNQQARDAEYLKCFDIIKFPRENVPTACLHLKAVASPLGNDKLPKNVICKILKGFAKSLTTSFNEVSTCHMAL